MQNKRKVYSCFRNTLAPEEIFSEISTNLLHCSSVNSLVFPSFWTRGFASSSFSASADLFSIFLGVTDKT